MDKVKLKLPYIICTVLAVVHCVISFFTDRALFVMPDRSYEHYGTALLDYSVCKVITLLVLVMFYICAYELIFGKGSRHENVLDVVKCALPYVIVVIGVLAIKLPQGYLSNDENAIYMNAVSLTHDTWFNYITTYYYIVSLMLIPFKYGPIIVKVIIQLFSVGYVVCRIKRYFGNRLGLAGYLLFVMYPVIAYTTSAHRLPVYFLVYLVLYTKLLFDALEKHSLGRLESAVILVVCAVLTQWRTEGIYLAVVIPALCILAYSQLRNVKNAVVFIVASVAIQFIISIPQNGLPGSDISGAANDRMKPFYAYTITNMYRNGLDLEKNAADLAIVDKYLSLEVIKAINEHYEDINYEDVLILFTDGYMGVREDATVDDFINYTDALKRIFRNNPGVFVRTRIGAFCYAALPYHITHDGSGIRGLVLFGISVVKSISYNLFIPLGVCIALFVYAIFRRRISSFFVFGGLLAHWFIVFILAPASYFKYYFPIYIMAYFYVIVLALWAVRNRKDKDCLSPLN